MSAAPHVDKILVECQSNLLATTITRPASNPTLKPSILVLHGAGASSQERSAYLANHFANLGHATLRFDHSGHGHSTGHIRYSSLALRQQEAQTMAARMQGPLTVIASSMGAQTAVMLTQNAEVKNLVFLAPAAYGPQFWNVSFGADFSFMLRTSRFWQNCAAWPVLEKFRGNILMVLAGREERVNADVARTYWAHTANAAHRGQLLFPHSDHSLQLWFDKHPPFQQVFLRHLAEIVSL